MLTADCAFTDLIRVSESRADLRGFKTQIGCVFKFGAYRFRVLTESVACTIRGEDHAKASDALVLIGVDLSCPSKGCYMKLSFPYAAICTESHVSRVWFLGGPYHTKRHSSSM